MKEIESEHLILAHLPDQDDPVAIYQFALSFDAYDKFEEETATAICREKRRSTLDELRCELFFASRADKFSWGFETLMEETYRELYPLFQKFLSQPSR